MTYKYVCTSLIFIRLCQNKKLTYFPDYIFILTFQTTQIACKQLKVVEALQILGSSVFLVVK